MAIAHFSTAVPNHLTHAPAPPAVSKTASLLCDNGESFYTSSKSAPASPGSRVPASTLFLGILRTWIFWYTVTKGISAFRVEVITDSLTADTNAFAPVFWNTRMSQNPYPGNFKYEVNGSLKLVIVAQNGICKFDFKNKLSNKYSTSMANSFCVGL